MSDRNDQPEFLTPPELEDWAALYALGLLEPAQKEQFERQLSHDPAAAGAVKRYTGAAGLVGESLEPLAPPQGLKNRILQSIEKPKTERPPLGAIRAFEGKWKPTADPGVSFKKLYFDKPSGLVTMLVKMEAGSTMGAHRHMRTEQCLILEGDLVHEDHVYGPGDFTWAEAGSTDPELRTIKGNLLLIIAGAEYHPLPA